MNSTRFNRGCTEHGHAANSGDVDQGRGAGQFTTSCRKTNPFPEDADRQPAPSPWPSHRRWCGQRHCILLHVLILNSLPLGAVQMKHTSILVRHCNLLMLQEGDLATVRPCRSGWMSKSFRIMVTRGRRAPMRRTTGSSMNVYLTQRISGHPPKNVQRIPS